MYQVDLERVQGDQARGQAEAAMDHTPERANVVLTCPMNRSSGLTDRRIVNLCGVTVAWVDRTSVRPPSRCPSVSALNVRALDQ